MKKIIFALALTSMLFVSCSSDDSALETQNTSTHKDGTLDSSIGSGDSEGMPIKDKTKD